MTYQNLLDGVVKFVLNDGHGGSQTVVPVVYVPNNDLYISGDQGGFEIVNVHPGSGLYTELELRGNWSGVGKSLLSINVKPGPRVFGVPGITYWPNINSISHQDPSGDVTVFFGNDEINAQIELTDRFDIVDTYVSQNGEIVIPATDVADAINRRISLELSINNTPFSQLLFLLETETEEFSLDGYLFVSGQLIQTGSIPCVATNYIDVYDVVDMVYSGKTTGNAYALMAYDDNRQVVRVLLAQSNFDNVHVPVDGTFRYVRACGYTASTPSLKLYFRTRG